MRQSYEEGQWAVMVVCPYSWKAKGGLRVQGQPKQQSQTLAQGEDKCESDLNKRSLWENLVLVSLARVPVTQDTHS